MLGSYEYLGLLGHPASEATTAIAAIRTLAPGTMASGCWPAPPRSTEQLEAKLAGFMQAEDAIVFSSGYVTNLATISALVGPGDCVIGDQWNHASIVDGCRMSGAEFLEFKHNDMDSLAEDLERPAAAERWWSSMRSSAWTATSSTCPPSSSCAESTTPC